MKLIIKNLKQVPHDVNVQSDQITVLDLKNEIEKAHGFDSTCLKLLYNGIVLENSKDLASYNIKEDFVIIMMNTKAKPVNVEQKGPEKIPVASQEQKVENIQVKKEEPKLDQPSQPETKPKPQPISQEKDYSKEIANLIEMGFVKSEAEAAIKAAKGNVELSIEFLYNGIPQNLPQNTHHESGGQTNTQLTEFQKAAKIIKVLCSQNPGNLQAILMNLQQQDPELFNQIKENENEFKTILQQPITQEDLQLFEEFSQQSGIFGGHQHSSGGGSSGTGTGAPRDKNKITLTKEEFEAVNRLKEMGNFSEMEVVQAYFACDKNEDMAANFLFETKMSEQDFGINIIPSQPFPQPQQPQSSSQQQQPKKEEEQKKKEDESEELLKKKDEEKKD